MSIDRREVGLSPFINFNDLAHRPNPPLAILYTQLEQNLSDFISSSTNVRENGAPPQPYRPPACHFECRTALRLNCGRKWSCGLVADDVEKLIVAPRRGSS